MMREVLKVENSFSAPNLVSRLHVPAASHRSGQADTRLPVQREPCH